MIAGDCLLAVVLQVRIAHRVQSPQKSKGIVSVIGTQVGESDFLVSYDICTCLKCLAKKVQSSETLWEVPSRSGHME